MPSPSHSSGPLPLQISPARQLGPNHRWVILGIGAVAQASFAMAFAGLPVAGVLMRAAYRMTTEQLGLVLGCMALGVTLSEIVWGLLTDVFGDRKVLLTGLLATGMALLALALFAAPSGTQVPSYRLLGGGLVLVGILGGSVNSSSGRAVMGWFTDGKRGLAMSIRQTAVPAGGALGAALLPWLADRHGFQSVFGILAVFSVLSALLTWRWLHEQQMPAQSSPYPAEPVETRSPLRRLDIWRLAVASGLLTVPQIAVLTFGGVFLHDHKAVDLATIAAVIVVVQVSGSIARIVMGQHSDKGSNRRNLVRGIGLLTAVVTAGLAIVTDAAIYWVVPLVCLASLFASAWHGVAYTEIAVMAGPGRAGTALGIIGMTIFASACITPAVIPMVLAIGSWQTVWALIGIIAFSAVWVCPGRIRSI
nr:MFS transporter [Burkholderia ubonensis]